MGILAQKRKELIISGILCVVLYLLSAIFLIRHKGIINTQNPPTAFAQEQHIRGAQAMKMNKATPSATFTPHPSININKPKNASPTAIIKRIKPPTATPTQPVTVVQESSVSITQQPASVPSATTVLQALNAYRQKKGIGPLTLDTKLQEFARSRAEHFASTGSMDNHAGFQSMMNDDGFAKMGFNALGENSSFGPFGSEENLIEHIYAGHAPHDENQLKSEWTHVGIGIKDDATDLVFGGRKIN